MLPPNNAAPDLTESLHEDTQRQLIQKNLEVVGLNIPREPDAVRPPPVLDPVILAPAKPRRGKIGLILSLLVVGPGAYWLGVHFLWPTQQPSILPALPVTNGAPGNAASQASSPSAVRKTKLKVLWRRGAAAKQRGDFGGARLAWEAGLRLDPDNVGFRESIAKLGKPKPAS